MIETIIKPPKHLALNLKEVKETLRITNKSEDIRLTSMINAATTWIEKMTHSAFITQTRKMTLHLKYDDLRPPTCKKLRFPLPTLPLRSIEAISFQGYQVNSYNIIEEQCLLLPHFHQPGELSLQYEVGYGSKPKDVPAPLKQAILLSVVRFYEDMTFPQEKEISSLVNPYRRITIH